VCKAFHRLPHVGFAVAEVRTEAEIDPLQNNAGCSPLRSLRFT
jgi:hypothetical protein